MSATDNITESRRCTLARPDDWMDMEDVPCPMQYAIWEGWITGVVPTMLATEYGARIDLQGRYPGVYRAWTCGPGMGQARWEGKLPDSVAEPVEEFTAYCHFPAECPKRVPGNPS